MESIRLTGPSAVVSAVPYLLGFEPDHCLVLLLSDVSGRVALTLRADLPADPPAGYVTDVLGRTGMVAAERCVAVIYDDADLAAPTERRAGLIAELAAGLLDQRRDLVDALLVSRGRWWSYRCSDPGCCPIEGNPVGDERGAAAAAEAVGRGLSVAANRDAFAAALVPSLPELKAEVASAAAKLSDPSVVSRAWSAWRDLAEQEFLDVVRTDPTGRAPHEIASLLQSLLDFRVRDPLLWHMAHERAVGTAAIPALAVLVAVAPPDLHAPVATLLAVCHWQSGNGAAAGSLLERVDPDYSLARLLRRALDVGLPPNRWIEMLQGLDLAGCRTGIAA